ncbi:MAG: hypothetical protein GC159_20530 [Phycisphaera sp.]|nr:hypothetical protein [Phycisphaera sp.]
MRRVMLLTFLLGLGAFIALIVWRGTDTIAAAVGQVGWRVLWIVPYFSVPLLLACASWLVLFRREHRPRAALGVLCGWITLAINWLLPVAQIGGEAARVPILARRGTPIEPAIANAVVDKTVQTGTQVIFTLIGLGLFISRFTDRDLVVGVLFGAGMLGGGTVAFFIAQRRGMFHLVERIIERFVSSEMMDRVPIKAKAVDAAVHEVYARPGHVLASSVLRLAFRFAMIGETFIVLRLMGHDVSLGDALILESLGQAARAGAFLIPAGLGAQEGAFILFGAAVGITGDAGLATSLCKRTRELIVGIPALLVWQWAHLRPRRDETDHDTSEADPNDSRPSESPIDPV